MSTTTVPLQITADGVDTFTAGTFAFLRIYTSAITGGERAAVDILMPHNVIAETIADLAYTLRDHAAYGALAEAVAAFFDAELVTKAPKS